MASGEGFSPAQRVELDRAIRRAETESRFEYSVYVGRAETESRPFAERLHRSLKAPERSVLIMVDPVGRHLEVVTGSDVRRNLSDEAVGLAVVAMQSAFAQGDLVGGIRRGLDSVAQSARRPRTLHG